MHGFLVFMIGYMILYKSCIQLVFSMLGKDFTSELLKTWSSHLVGVLMLGKDFTSDLLKTWSLHLLCRPCNSKTQHFLQATIFETSAAALCGTTGIS